MPSYDLCPQVRITEIGDQIAQAIAFAAARVPGPIRLVGHSAGGQLVARMTPPRDDAPWQSRLEKVVSISPVADLAPLMKTSMNVDLHLDEEEVQRESPVHLPRPSVPVTVWVGADERPVFLEQSAALMAAFDCEQVIEPSRHHFDVIDGLNDPSSALMRALLA
jgi:acetyl esterase/lipase